MKPDGAMMAHQIGVVAAAASGANSLALSEDEEGGKKPSLGIAKGGGCERERGGNNVMQ